jgi:hypothetical protein
MNGVGVGRRSQQASGGWKLNRVEISEVGRYGNLPCRLLGVGRLSKGARKHREWRERIPPYELLGRCMRRYVNLP